MQFCAASASSTAAWPPNSSIWAQTSTALSWSAHVLDDAPETIAAVHRSYIEAGADCIETASYQVSRMGYAEIGVAPERADAALLQSVDLARKAASEFPAQQNLIAVSLGPYGAALHNGSEYHGNYDCSHVDLVAFHAARIEVLGRAFKGEKSWPSKPSRPSKKHKPLARPSPLSESPRPVHLHLQGPKARSPRRTPPRLCRFRRQLPADRRRRHQLHAPVVDRLPHRRTTRSLQLPHPRLPQLRRGLGRPGPLLDRHKRPGSLRCPCYEMVRRRCANCRRLLPHAPRAYWRGRGTCRTCPVTPSPDRHCPLSELLHLRLQGAALRYAALGSSLRSRHAHAAHHRWRRALAGQTYSAAAQDPKQLVSQAVQIELIADQNDHSRWIYYDIDRKPTGATQQWVAENRKRRRPSRPGGENQPLSFTAQRNIMEQFIHDPSGPIPPAQIGRARRSAIRRHASSPARSLPLDHRRHARQHHPSPFPAQSAIQTAHVGVARLRGHGRLDAPRKDPAPHRQPARATRAARSLLWRTLRQPRRRWHLRRRTARDRPLHLANRRNPRAHPRHSFFLFFKNISQEEDEQKTHFQPLPGDISLQQAETKLLQQNG